MNNNSSVLTSGKTRQYACLNILKNIKMGGVSGHLEYFESLGYFGNLERWKQTSREYETLSRIEIVLRMK